MLTGGECVGDDAAIPWPRPGRPLVHADDDLAVRRDTVHGSQIAGLPPFCGDDLLCRHGRTGLAQRDLATVKSARKAVAGRSPENQQHCREDSRDRQPDDETARADQHK